MPIWTSPRALNSRSLFQVKLTTGSHTHRQFQMELNTNRCSKIGLLIQFQLNVGQLPVWLCGATFHGRGPEVINSDVEYGPPCLHDRSSSAFHQQTVVHEFLCRDICVLTTLLKIQRRK